MSAQVYCIYLIEEECGTLGEYCVFQTQPSL